MEERPGPHPWVLLLLQLPLPQGSGVEEVEDLVLRISWAAPRGMEGYQRREATPVHALHGEPLPGPHRHQTQGIESIYRAPKEAVILLLP